MKKIYKGLVLSDSNKIYSKAVTKSTSGDFDLIFSITLEAGEANMGGEYPISEAGLFTGSGKLFAHKCFSIVTKNSNRVFRFEWKIMF